MLLLEVDLLARSMQVPMEMGLEMEMETATVMGMGMVDHLRVRGRVSMTSEPSLSAVDQSQAHTCSMNDLKKVSDDKRSSKSEFHTPSRGSQLTT